jgi:hypothetical protein
VNYSNVLQASHKVKEPEGDEEDEEKIKARAVRTAARLELATWRLDVCYPERWLWLSEEPNRYHEEMYADYISLAGAYKKSGVTFSFIVADGSHHQEHKHRFHVRQYPSPAPFNREERKTPHLALKRSESENGVDR